MAAYVQAVDEPLAKTTDDHPLIATDPNTKHVLIPTDSSIASSSEHDVDTQSDTSVEEESKPSARLNDLYPVSGLDLPDHHIDDVRSLRVAVIGAGLSGVTAGVLLPAKVPKIQLTIFDKNEDVSGTWLENVYPGVRCDIPAHVYQSTFEANTQWSQQFAPGHEIRDYWQSVARKHDVYKYVKFGHRVQDVSWDDSTAEWTISGRDLKSGSTFEHKADFVLTAIGRFNDWKLPNYPGVSEYKGHIRHTSNWDPSFDATGKTVAVIGNGASGIQVVPNIQRIAKHVDHYARNKTWIAGSWAGDERTFDPQWYSEEKKAELKDPEAYLAFRKEIESKYWRRFPSTFRGATQNVGMRDNFIKIMTQRTAADPSLISRIIPDFNPNCRRLTPGPGYLEALTEPNVTFIQDPISHFTEAGIVTTTGEHRLVDAVLCATGAAIDFIPPFSIRARGINLQDVWKPDTAHSKRDPIHYGWPYTYLGLAVPNVPNLLFIAGPHGTGPSGTVPHSVEVQLTYYAKLLRKVSSQGIKSVSPSRAAADDFVAYADAFFPKTVLTDNCSSWANGGKAGQRIHGIWPGSAGHVTLVRKEPRWEDWEWEYWHESKNRFVGWLGNGWTRKERDEESDIVPYLKKQGEVDLRSVHEEWWEWP
ncbi:putative sterigmatocystin biosynthesis monooxygenase stcW [Cyphellophora attinorum]|uniref:Putative sterigmatocystin biosynthesis monooxygenase stcW n=1 Tax=Cyphellophora attinorum TaxID=1664694 RepID=A0A0N1NZ83_9EURO|nr:putative sterigmatocystin biosynthesis monooxygenase stcW [Phialophora attinorum]KPI36940.1 putative sterigmatocystin biosynthesis monooxygenase stcW [Phialophora attinorum]